MLDVWLDFDPAGFVATGLDVDDDLAYLCARALERRGDLRLVGVSVVAGNAALRDTVADAEVLLRHAGDDAPIVAGASWDDMRVAWPSMRRLHALRGDVAGAAGAAARAMRRAVRAAEPRTVTILALGPLTNVAALLALDPSVARRLRRVVAMGGALDGGPLDLNWMSDRAAARALLAAGVPTTVVPLDACAQAAFAAADVAAVAACPGAAARALAPKMRLQAYAMPLLVNGRLARRFPDTAHAALLDGAAAFVPWDVVALFAATDPASYFDEWREVALAAPPCDGGEPCDGTVSALVAARPVANVTAWLEGDDARAFGVGSGLALAPTRLRAGAVVASMRALLCEVPAAGPVPRVLPGAAPHAAAAVAAAVAAPLLLRRWWRCHS